MLADILQDCEDSVKKQQMFELGGQALLGQTASAGDFADAGKRTAYVYLKLPHNSPSAQELPLPLPTDILTQPVIINVEFNNASDFFQSSTTVVATPSPLPNQFALAQAQFAQVHFDDRGEQLARKVNMSEMAYSYPLKYFSQETFRIQGLQGSQVNNITLTGLRSGNCIGIKLWFKETGNPNPWAWVSPTSITLSVNGLIYFDSRNGQQQLWNLIEKKTGSSWTTDVITVTGSAFRADPVVSYWVWIPFAQHSETLAGESELSHGLSLMNSIVNLQVGLPAPVIEGNTFTCNAEYCFNSTLLGSRGNIEYIF